jgi:holliday junction DNA helicase ruvA
MIAHLTGRIIDKNLNTLIIDVMGVGYEVAVPTSDASRLVLGEITSLKIYHHIREQSQELFGFLELGSKELFKLLITVQGIGPKAALAILSIGEFEAVRSAIARGDSKYIQQASGVGKKTAERVCVDLSDKIGVPSVMSAELVQTELNNDDEAVETLMALGYNLTDATALLSGIDVKLTTQERVKLAWTNRR